MSAITFQPLAMAKAPSARRSARKSSFQQGAKISPVMKKVRSFPARVKFFFDLFEFESAGKMRDIFFALSPSRHICLSV